VIQNIEELRLELYIEVLRNSFDVIVLKQGEIQVRGPRPVHGVAAGSANSERPWIRVPEVVVRKQNWFPRRLGQGVGEAVPEIQLGRMSAALTEITVGLASNARLGFVNRLDDKLCLPEEIVKPSARNRISAPIDNDRCFDVADRGNAAPGRVGNRVRTGPSFRFIAKVGFEPTTSGL
jgi:hypothetical protein